MSEEMEFSESCEKLVRIIQANEHEFIETYTLMLCAFVEAYENGETPRMALALAKDAPGAADRIMEQYDTD